LLTVYIIFTGKIKRDYINIKFNLLARTMSTYTNSDQRYIRGAYHARISRTWRDSFKEYHWHLALCERICGYVM